MSRWSGWPARGEYVGVLCKLAEHRQQASQWARPWFDRHDKLT